MTGSTSADSWLAGRYRLVREIGRGGIGTVWEAVLEPLGSPVAIKFLRTTALQRDERAAERFVREARALAAVQHDNIVKIHDVGSDPREIPFIVMERLRGRPLNALIATYGPLPFEVVIELGLQLCRALGEAHRHGIVHRDIKPSNIFVTDEGPTWQCKLLDFGLCKQLDPRALEGATTSGVILGTPGYMAPEQAFGDRVDARADVYGLGCVLFEMLTGRPAFSASRAALVLSAQLQGRSCAAEVATGTIHRRFGAFVERMLRVAPDERPSSADEVAEVLVRMPKTVARRGLPPRRAVRVAGLLAGLGILMIAIVIREPHWESNASDRAAEHDIRVDDSHDESTSSLAPNLPSTAASESTVATRTSAADSMVTPELVPPTSSPTPNERDTSPVVPASRGRSGSPTKRVKRDSQLRPSSAEPQEAIQVSLPEPDPTSDVATSSPLPSPPAASTQANRRRWAAPGIRDPFDLLATDP